MSRIPPAPQNPGSGRLVAALFLLFSLLHPSWSGEIGPDRKIIKWGWDQPDTAYLRANIAGMEELPFDGVIFILHASTPTGPVIFSHQIWGARRFTEEELLPAMEDLRATTFNRFTDNFICLNVMPGNVGWFDPAFEAVIENARLAARVAAAGEVKGFMLDVEMYMGQVFHYDARSPELGKSFEETALQVRRRGGEFMRAIQKEMDSPTILLTFAHSFLKPASQKASEEERHREAWHQEIEARLQPLREALAAGDRETLRSEARWRKTSAADLGLTSLAQALTRVEELAASGDLDGAGEAMAAVHEGFLQLKAQSIGYVLLPPFIDGLLEAATGETRIVDAYELSYPFREDSQFAQAREKIAESETFSDVPEAYRERMRAGFGLYMDQGWPTIGWHPEDPEQNLLSPLEFEYALHRALTHTDRYVWVYSEQPNWWTGDKLPAGYIEAVRNARADHDPGWKTDRQIPSPREEVLDESTTGGEGGFDPLRDRYEVLLDLPKSWLFRTDPENRGERERWHLSATDSASWQPIEIGRFWDNQGHRNYEGVAWYRTAISVPVLETLQPLFLAFGAVDENAAVYVNGQLAGKYGLVGHTWNSPFEIEVTEQIRPGEENLIVVRVENAEGVGGIWKPVKLVAARGR